jgi:hypothetical protein
MAMLLQQQKRTLIKFVRFKEQLITASGSLFPRHTGERPEFIIDHRELHISILVAWS